MKYNSNMINQENNSIFKQVNTNIILDYQKNKYINELIQNQDIYSNYKDNIIRNKNLQKYLNGTTEPDENNIFTKTQRTKFSNLANKSNYNTNVNTTKNKPTLNRYNSYKRITTTVNNNDLMKLQKNNKINKNKKCNGSNKNKLINHNNSKINNNNQMNNQRMPISNNKKNIIPQGNNKYKTIGDTYYYSNITNKMKDDMNIYNNMNRAYYNERQNHNTIDLNNLISNHTNNINKKYNMKKYNTNTNFNQNKNRPVKKTSYNYKNADIKRNGSNIRPKTPDNNKRGKSMSRFNNNNMKNQRTKTPDRQRNKMKLNLNKDYLNTIDNNKNNKTTNHYNHIMKDYYNHTIDNNSNNGKYKYTSSRLNTNDYFILHKKTINNYDNRQNMTITDNTTLTNNNSSLKKNFFGKIYNNGNQTRPQKRLSKNSSQGNILGPNNYNINLGSNGINHVYKNVNENYNYKNYHSNCNTNLITPIKYINQKSNFKAENIQLTQIRPPNNYNLYNETFQSFGTNLTTLTNNQDLKSQRNNNYNENNNYFEMKTRQENIKEISKNNDYEYNNKNTNYDFNKFKELYRQNLNNETERRQPKLQEKNGNCNNVYNTYIPATINNIGNKTYSYFNNIQKNNKINENEKNENEKSNNFNDIDFNDLDQFSPPYHSNQFDLNKNIDKNFTIENKYMNLGCIEERNKNYETVNYDCNFGNNRKVIDDFIKQLKTNI